MSQYRHEYYILVFIVFAQKGVAISHPPVTCYSFGTDFQLEMSGSSIWSDELLLAEAVEKCADINSLVMIKGRQLSQLMVASYHGNIKIY